MWASLNPGSSVRPWQSMTLVRGDARLRISALLPTATIRLPEIATASARGMPVSMVNTLALTMARLTFWVVIMDEAEESKAYGECCAIVLGFSRDPYFSPFGYKYGRSS